MNTQKLNSAIAEFTKKKKSNAAYYEENWAERKERKEYYQSFTKDKLLAMTEEEFLEYISKLWSMLRSSSEFPFAFAPSSFLLYCVPADQYFRSKILL